MIINKKIAARRRNAKEEQIPEILIVSKEYVPRDQIKVPAKFAKGNELLLRAKLLPH